MSLCIVDAGIGNTGSVLRAFRKLGASPVLADRAEQLKGATHIVLPGVGAFNDAMRRIHSGGWAESIRDRVGEGIPLLGICLGMQLLADKGYEGGECEGLGLVPGSVVPLADLGCTGRIPHVGWNTVACLSHHPLLQSLEVPQDYYFVHSFGFQPKLADHVLGVVDYDVPIPAIVARGRVMGAQFHPEKSSRAGLRLLSNFLALSPC